MANKDWKALQAEADAKNDEAVSLMGAWEAEDRGPTPEEKEAFDALCVERDEFDTRAKCQQNPLAREGELSKSQGRLTAPGVGDGPLATAATITDSTTGDDSTAVRVGAVRERFEEDPKRGWQSSDQFFMAVRANTLSPGTVPPEVSQRLRSLAIVEDGGVKMLAAAGAAAGMSQDIGSAGGFAVPPGFESSIWDGMNDGGPDDLLSLTTPFDMTGVDSWTIPANAETSRATGSRYGGVQGYHVGEAATITVSNPTLRQITIEMNEIACLVPATDKLLRNANGMGAWISKAATEELKFLANNDIIAGTGAGQSLGVIDSDATVSVAKETGQAATTIVKENIEKMWDRLHPRATSPIWYINKNCGRALRGLTQDVGTGGHSVYLPPSMSIADAPRGSLMGVPVREVEYCKTLGTVGDIILADLSFVASGTQGVQTASSIHVYFTSMQTAFRFSMAIDTRPFLLSPITPFNGTDTLSPFVTLATRA